MGGLGMYKGYRYIDSDAHVLEPEDLWERYLEPEFRKNAPRTVAHWISAAEHGLPEAIDGLAYHQETHVGGESMPAFDTGYPIPGAFQMPGCAEVYDEYRQMGFSPAAYQLVLERSGIDYMVLYPTAGLTMNCAVGVEPKQAAAHCRAYNNWLADFCRDSDRRLVGIGAIDLRDPALAAAEARRCVIELGFHGVQINPEPLPDYPPLQDQRYGDLWSTLEELDVPLAIHLAPISPHNVARYYFGPWHMGIGASAFILGNMSASVALILGGVLERHPKLRVVHLETGCGWAPFWLERMEAGILGSTRGVMPLKLTPTEYFQRQCCVAADPDDPWIPQFIETLGDDCLVTNTDFGHPEGKGYVHAIEDTLALENVSEESLRKIMWDNAARLYGLS